MRYLGKKNIFLATKAMLAAIIGSTMDDGTDTHPRVASPKVMVCARVNVETCRTNGFHFRDRRKIPNTKRI